MRDYIADVRARIDDWDRCYPGNHNVELMIDDAKERIDALTAMVKRLADERETECSRRWPHSPDSPAFVRSMRTVLEARALIGEDGNDA